MAQNHSSNIAGALTYSRNDNNTQAMSVQPRQPRNLQGLLRFAMDATKAEDAPGNSQLGPLDEERRKFLEEALKSLTVDIVQVLQDAIKILTNIEKIKSIHAEDPIPDDVKTSFENLLQFVDDIDVANDFYKMGGFAVFAVAFGCENDEVRALASTLLGELCQNNPFCQSRVLECGLLNVLLNLVNTEKGNALSKCVFAISSICREFEPACRELCAQEGCKTLVQLLQAPETQVRTKAAFLVRYLCHHYNDAKAKFVEMNLVKILAEHIKSGRDETTEHLLNILLALTEGLDSTVLQQCRDPNVGLKNILEEHLKHPSLHGDTYLEEKEYCEELLQRIFANYTPVDSSVEEAER